MKTIEGLVSCLFEPQLADWAARLSETYPSEVPDLKVVFNALRLSISAEVASKLSRLVIFEVKIARESGALSGESGAERWHSFYQSANNIRFWQSINAEYPGTLDKIRQIIDNQLAAVAEFFERWVSDRYLLNALNSDCPLGSLVSVKFNYGDKHDHGRAVIVVNAEYGTVVYKPRSLAVDQELKNLIKCISASYEAQLGFDVPNVINRGRYGWAAFIVHNYAANEAALVQFYRGIGQCLSLLRLLRGNDFHSENVISCNGMLMLVDCETLFAPNVAPKKSGLGNAVDKAADLLSNSVVGVGLLPMRGDSLGFRGVDASGVGSLPKEQPLTMQPQIVDEGTDDVRLEKLPISMVVPRNQPSPEPRLADYWHEILQGLDSFNNYLVKLDGDGGLYDLLKPFESVTVRYVARATESYSEISYMLWHPESLYKPVVARQRAATLLGDMAENSALAPYDSYTINSEITELLRGDIPVFSAFAGEGLFINPEAGKWEQIGNLVAGALDQWRNTDFELDRQSTQASIVSAYINDGWLPTENSMRCPPDATPDLQNRAKSVAADIMKDLLQHAIWGADGTVSWIAPTYDENGWSVRPLGPDLYGGSAGVAILAFAYAREQRAGRAIPLEEIDELCVGTRKTLDKAAAHWFGRAKRKYKSKPLPPGGYIGISSLIYAYLLLYRWSGDTKCLDTAALFADGLKESVSAYDSFEILTGSSGAIPALLHLNAHLDHDHYLSVACELGDKIAVGAITYGDTLYWPHALWPNGIGGFAHGVSGISSSMARLARVSGIKKYKIIAEKGFRFEDSLFCEKIGGWRDLRQIENFPSASAWCHGSVGIGLARLIVDPEAIEYNTQHIVKAAGEQTWETGLGWNFCICHGDMGSWELLSQLVSLDLQPQNVTERALLGSIVSALEKHGPVCGIARDTFSPSLMSGTGGVAYQLLRSDPESELPSIATLSM